MPHAACRVLPVLLSLLAGCGRVPAEHEDTRSARGADAPEQEHALRWMGHWLHEDLRETLVRETAEEFSFAHPEIDLHLKFPQEVMGVRSKPRVAAYIAEMIREDRCDWDVIWLDDHIYRLTAQELDDPEWGRKYLVDFEQVPGFRESQKDFIIDSPIYRGQTGGMLVGPYVEGYLYALWYNRDVAERLGLNIKERGMTFDDLLGYVRRVHEYNRTAKTPIAAFYEAGDWCTLEIVFQNLVKSEIPDFEEAIREERSDAKTAALRKALEAFEELGRYDPLISSHEENIWFETRHLVLEDRALFYVGGTWMYSHWRGIDDKKLQKMIPAELPVFREADHTLGGYIPTWAVMKNSPNRDDAVCLLMWWSRPAIAEKWVRYTKNPTGVRGNLDSPTLGSDPYERYQFDMTRKYGSRVHYTADIGYLLGRENSHLLPFVKERLRFILTGRKKAQSAYEEIEARCW